MVTIPAIRAKAQQRTCMPKEPCEKGSPYENRKSGGKTRYREEILCLNAKPWVPFSPLPLFPLFCAPQGSDSSPSSLPPRLLRVCACWRDWTHARLHLTFPILDILHHPHQGAFWRKKSFDPNVTLICWKFEFACYLILWSHSQRFQVPRQLLVPLLLKDHLFRWNNSVPNLAAMWCWDL